MSSSATVYHLDFAVIGAQKCATSWLYYCLQDHPQICLPSKKREIAYIGGPLFQEKGDQWFFDRFRQTENAMLGDVSVDYLYHSHSASKLKAYMPNPRLVVSLRNPIERFISAYFWLCRNSVLPDCQIDDWISTLPSDSDDWSRDVGEQASEVVCRGFYASQLQAFVDVFGPNQLLLLLYEDIQSQPLESIQKVYRFLDVDADFVPANLNFKPKQNSYNRFLILLERRFRNRFTSHAVNLAHQAISRFSKMSAPISVESRQKLFQIYQPHIESLQQLMKSLPAEHCPDPGFVETKWRPSAY